MSLFFPSGFGEEATLASPRPFPLPPSPKTRSFPMNNTDSTARDRGTVVAGRYHARSVERVMGMPHDATKDHDFHEGSRRGREEWAEAHESPACTQCTYGRRGRKGLLGISSTDALICSRGSITYLVTSNGEYQPINVLLFPVQCTHLRPSGA